MTRRIVIDPVTRIEGHGAIHVFLDAAGRVQRARLQIPEFRAFESLCEGRAVEDLPALTAKICGICPTAHHIAASKALDQVYGVQPPPAARRLRELMHLAYVYEDHLLHLYALSVADFLPTLRDAAGQRNLLGVLQFLGADGDRFLRVRRRVRELNGRIGGSALYPTSGVPGGVTTVLVDSDRSWMLEVCAEALAFAQTSLQLFHSQLLGGAEFQQWLQEPVLCHPSYYLGTVDADGLLNLYHGDLRITAPDGTEFMRGTAAAFADHLAERIEEDSYGKPTYLRRVGWRGFEVGASSGVYRVGPLARINVADAIATPLAQRELERLRDYFGQRSVHHTMAYHWARLVEVLYAAERMEQLVRDPQLWQSATRSQPQAVVGEGVGACEAPRGTLIHHYRTDAGGITEAVNLLVATQHNYAAINVSIQAAARRFLQGENPSAAARNRVEMAMRAYDPCLSCTTHALRGERSSLVRVIPWGQGGVAAPGGAGQPHGGGRTAAARRAARENAS